MRACSGSTSSPACTAPVTTARHRGPAAHAPAPARPALVRRHRQSVHSNSAESTGADLLAVAYRAPIGIVCCVSALVVHDLTDEIPACVRVAVPRPHRPPRISHPPTEVFRFAAATFELGLSAVEAAPGEHVRIYNPERTVVDLMRLRHRLGEPLALSALRRYLRRRDARPDELLALARPLGVSGPVRAALDVASAE